MNPSEGAIGFYPGKVRELALCEHTLNDGRFCAIPSYHEQLTCLQVFLHVIVTQQPGRCGRIFTSIVAKQKRSHELH